MRTSKRKLLIGAAALVLLGYILYRSRDIHLSSFFGDVWTSIRTANPLYILISVLTIYICFALRALRWIVFQKNLGQADFWPTYGITLAGFSAIVALSRVGEFVRPLLLSRKSKVPVADMFGIFVIERLFDFVCTAVIASLALLLYSPHESAGEYSSAIQKGARMGGAMMAAGIICVISFLVYLRFHGSGVIERTLEGWRPQSGWRGGVAKIILGFVRGIQTIRSWRDLIQAVLISALHWYLIAMVYVLVTHSFQGKLSALSVRDCLLVQAISLVGSVLQLPAVGGGQQALAIFAYVKVFGVENGPATAAALLLYVVTFASCTIAGVPLLIREGLSFGKLRKMAEHEKEELEEEAARGKVS
jgi:uncharacterized protein (TIRG00374 family)